MIRRGLTALVVLALVAGATLLWRHHTRDYSITAQVSSSTGIYVGDAVTVLGVPVGKIEGIEPTPTHVNLRLRISRGVKVPADAHAAVVSQSLVASRTLQLTPVYGGGPVMPDGATISLANTVVPMEWDDLKTALADVAASVGPTQGDRGSAARAVDTAATVLAPHAGGINDTVTQLAAALTAVSDGRSDLFAVLRNLQLFITAMRGSTAQVGDLQQRLATVASVLGNNEKVVGDSLVAIDEVIVEVQQFVNANRDIVVKTLGSATELTTMLKEQRANLEGILHQAPTQIANFYNIYKPALGVMSGVFSAPNFENPVAAVCGGFAATGQPSSKRGAELCIQYLGAYLGTLTTSYPNMLTNPTRSSFTDPGQQIPSVPGVIARVPGLTGPPLPPTTVPKNLAGLLLPKGQR